MKKIVTGFIGLLMLSAFNANAQNWETYYGNQYADSIADGIITSSGDLVVLGNFWDKTGGYQNDNFGVKNKFQIVLTPNSSATTPTFAKYYWYGGFLPSGTQKNTIAESIVEVGSEFLVVGSFEENGTYLPFLFRINASTGAVIASYEYDFGTNSRAKDIVVGSNSVYILGDYEGTSDNLWIAEVSLSNFSVTNHQKYDLNIGSGHENERDDLAIGLSYLVDGSSSFLFMVTLSTLKPMTNDYIGTSGHATVVFTRINAATLAIQKVSLYTEGLYGENVKVNHFRQLQSVGGNIEFGLVGNYECTNDAYAFLLMHLDSSGAIVNDYLYDNGRCGYVNKNRFVDFVDFQSVNGTSFRCLGVANEPGVDDVVYVEFDNAGTITQSRSINGSHTDYYKRMLDDGSGNFILFGNENSFSTGSISGYKVSDLALKSTTWTADDCHVDNLQMSDMTPYFDRYTLEVDYMTGYSTPSVTSSDMSSEYEFGCDAATAPSPSGLNQKVNGIGLYPNPSTGMVRLDLSLMEGASFLIVLRDLQGKELYQTNLSGGNLAVLDFTSFSNGTYLIDIMGITSKTTLKVTLVD